MHVIGQNDPSDNLERLPLFDYAHRMAKRVDALDKQTAGAIRQVDGEEKCPAGGVGPLIVHVVILDVMLGIALLTPTYQSAGRKAY
jgi:hypothetical protein